MWKNIKKKVSDLIYEEYEDPENEEESQVELVDEAQEETKSEEIAQTEDRRRVSTRMTFQYPREDSSFRFPVIPDQTDPATNQRKPSSQVTGRSTEASKPAFERRRGKRRRTINRQREMYSRPIYEQKKLAEELENIPAYERRRRERFLEEESDTKTTDSMRDSFMKVNQFDREQVSYSKPDELDAVFKKKNQPEVDREELEQESNDAQAHELDSYKVDQLADEEQEQELEQPFRDEVAEKTDDQLAIDKVAEEAIEQVEEKSKLATVEQPTHTNRQGETNGWVTNDRKTTEQASPDQSGPYERKEFHEQLDLPHYLLDDVIENQTDDRHWLRTQKQLLEQTLEHFNVDAEVVAITQGPTVTRIEIQPALGVKVSRIRNLVDDIKLNLAARDIRIEAPIPGKHTVGIEIPNESPQVVHLQEMIESESFQEASSPLTVALGLTIEGEPYFTDINKMPHGLIAGATGSGKSVCINTMILSLLYKSHYDDVKLMLIDPKMVELTQYNGIPHLLTPVITDAKAATVALKWAVDEMERRYELFVENQVRNIKRYNRKVIEDKLPYIVIIIDELADLMLVSPQEVEDYISRIAQKARAAGIHLILATQRPSVDVITGLIKANIPSRIAFAVSSQVDSRTILDANGAEKLLGKGDMLFVENGMNKQIRLQGPFVSDDEIDRVVHYLRSVAEPEYLFEHDELFLQLEMEEEDELFEEVVEFVLTEERASTSLLQRRFRIGYNRAARLIDSMHDRGIISAQNGSRPRDVLITKAQWEHQYE